MSDINELYQRYLGRAPDPGALAYYGNKSTNQLLNDMLVSPEYKAREAAGLTTPKQVVPQTNTGGLGGLGGIDPNKQALDMQAAAQKQWMEMQTTFQQQMQDSMSSWQKSLGAGFGKTYNPTGTGGTFSGMNSPVYRPGGETDTGLAAKNGFGGTWGNGPFRATF